MLNKININSERQKLIVYLALIVVTFAVFWNVDQYDFINFDDHIYVTENIHIQSKITLDGIHWAFTTKHDGNYVPLVWLSYMLDYQFFGLKAGSYHLTNLILHILSALLLFLLFNHMTGAIWRSAFVAALFALHPLHVESVAWISERKDVLSAFFWMLALCFYVYYTEKPVIRRYMLVLLSFACALMSKPMVVTLPFVLLLLDYWPLGRWTKKISQNRNNSTVMLIGEKIPFLVLTIIASLMTIGAQNKIGAIMERIPFSVRISNALISYVAYLKKIFWPVDLAVFYPYNLSPSLWEFVISTIILSLITLAVFYYIRKLPFLFVGWFWYFGTLIPVIGLVQAGRQAMADRYTYLPSIGIAFMLAWGIPLLFPPRDIRKKILFPAGMACLVVLALLAWQQCGHWKNSVTLFSHAVQVTKNNALAYELRGAGYLKRGQYQLAIDDFNEAIKLKPNFVGSYYIRGVAYAKLGQYQSAIKDYDQAMRLKADYADAYNNRGVAYNNLGQYQRAIENYNEAIRLKPDYADAHNNRGVAYAKLGRYQLAIEGFNKAIELKSDDSGAYANRGRAYLLKGDNNLGCRDARKACHLGNCEMLEKSQKDGNCR